MTHGIRIRTSEDVRSSYEDILRFIVLSQVYFKAVTKPSKVIPCVAVSWLGVRSYTEKDTDVMPAHGVGSECPNRY